MTNSLDLQGVQPKAASLDREAVIDRLRRYSAAIRGESDLRVGLIMCLDAMTEAADLLALTPTDAGQLEPVARPSEDDIVQLLFSLQRGAAQLRPTAAKILELFSPPKPSEAAHNLGAWMSAALDDDKVCEAMKADIRAWFEAGCPAPAEAPAIAEGDLTTPYTPTAIHYREADILEYIQRDEPTFSQPVQAGLDVLLTMTDREPIGWRVYGWSKISPSTPNHSQET